MLRRISTAFLLICTLFLTSCTTEVENTSVSFTAMDTYIKLTASADHKKVLNRGKKYILSLDKQTNRYDELSDISKINKNGGGVVNDDLLPLLKSAQEYARLTNGAFNPCLGNVIDLWQIGKDDFRIPKKNEIDKAVSSSSYTSLEIDGSKISLDNGTTLDLGGIAKGYACDKTAEILKQAGVKSALLDVGGSIGAIGTKENDKPWVISLADPKGGQSIGTLNLENCFAVTSGNYQRFSEKNGKRYCHIFNNFGRPVNNKFTSVTVVCDSAQKADALSTALFVMGPLGTKRFYENVGGFEAVYVTDSKVIVTPGLTTKFTHTNKGYAYEVQQV